MFSLLREAQWMVSLELPDLRTLALVSWGAALVVASLWLLYSFRDLRRRRERFEEGRVDALEDGAVESAEETLRRHWTRTGQVMERFAEQHEA